MPFTGVISRDDLHDVDPSSYDGDRRQAAADLVAVVDEGRLAEESDASLVLGLAAEFLRRADDPAGAMVLAERSIAADPEDPFARAQIGELLILGGKVEEGLARLEELRELLTVSPAAAPAVAGALHSVQRAELAVEWLTPAMEALLDEFQQIADTPAEAEWDKEDVLLSVAAARHELRHELNLPHDDLDDVAGELLETEESAAFTEGMSALWWPQAEHGELLRRWPELAKTYGSTWDSHRELTEVAMQVYSTAGAPSLILLPGSVDELISFVGPDADPADGASQDAYTEFLDDNDRGVAWPPERNAPCWCGSGVKYKKCCLPRTRRP